jgi:hypothetical protein
MVLRRRDPTGGFEELSKSRSGLLTHKHNKGTRCEEFSLASFFAPRWADGVE